MDKKKIRAYLWQEVIRLGFCPSGEKEQKKWLRKYLGSLKDFLGPGSYPDTPKSNSKIIFSYSPPIDLDIECSIAKKDKFSVKFLYLPPSNNKESSHNPALMWNHDVDGEYFTFPVQEFLTYHRQSENEKNKKKESDPEINVRKEFSDEDLAIVLDGLIFHPAAHQHIESPIDKHEIRIGGGIGNAFQFLFHLRYQLCPDDNTKKAEKKRLIRLFADAIREKSKLLSINQLMPI